MKKILILALIITSAFGMKAQWTYPTSGIASYSGSVGIGTDLPNDKFSVYNRFLVSNDGVIKWGSSADCGLLSWDIGRVIIGGQASKALAFHTDGSEKFRIQTNGNVGIGLNAPNAKLQIYNQLNFNSDMTANGQDHILFSSNDPGNGGYFGGITWESGTRRRASIVGTREHADTDHVGIAFFTKGTDGVGPMFESMRINYAGNVGIGTTNPTSLLTVAGKIASREVEVTVNAGADFVFAENYPIKTIEEVEAYIKENKHLPEIAPAKEMEANGIELGAMNIKLLQKIEELTLYLIEQNKALKEQNERITELEKQLRK